MDHDVSLNTLLSKTQIRQELWYLLKKQNRHLPLDALPLAYEYSIVECYHGVDCADAEISSVQIETAFGGLTNPYRKNNTSILCYGMTQDCVFRIAAFANKYNHVQADWGIINLLIYAAELVMHEMTQQTELTIELEFSTAGDANYQFMGIEMD